eukprot:2818293-Karenia_brevis.AAC.1
MDDLPHLDYLDERPSPPRLRRWITLPYLNYLDEDLHHVDHSNGRPSPCTLPGQTTFTIWIT